MTSPPPSLPDLRFGAVVAEWARCAALHVEAVSMGGATLLLCPELDHRLRVAREIEGARFAVTRTLEGSASQRNVERQGLHVFRRLEVWGVNEVK